MPGNFSVAGDILIVQGNMDTDDQLILEFQKGSREAFRELFERYRDPVYGFFRRRLGDPGRAEELAGQSDGFEPGLHPGQGLGQQGRVPGLVRRQQRGVRWPGLRRRRRCAPRP